MLALRREKLERAELLVRLSSAFPVAQCLVAIAAMVFGMLGVEMAIALAALSMSTLALHYFSLRQLEDASYEVFVKLYPLLLALGLVGGLVASALLVFQARRHLKEAVGI